MIRKMKREDAQCVIDMMRDFYTSDAVHTNGSEEIFRRNVENCLGDFPYAEGYVFEDDGKVFGYSLLATGYVSEFAKPCIWIEDLYLQPEYRGKGVGRHFFSFLEEQYPGWAFRLESEPENEPAVHLYRSCGFKDFPYVELIKGGL